MNIIFYSPDPERTQQWVDCFQQQGVCCDVRLWQADDEARTIQADYAVVWLPPEGFFKSVSGLKAVFNMGAGVDAILKLESLPQHLDVVRLDDKEIGNKMSEYIVHAVAEITRQMDAYRQDGLNKAWDPCSYAYFDDWPIGIMGLGKIGRQIAEILLGLGYPINGWSRSRQKDSNGIRCYHGSDQFDQFLNRSRIVVNVLPLTHETEGILNAHAFEKMPDNGYIINIGRGEHLDEDALLNSLDQGQLAGAVLDVFRQEPLPSDHPFWQEPKIRITPHVAGATNLRLAMRQIADKIRTHQNGERLSGVVDKQIGY